MPFYFGETTHISQASARVVGVDCDQCGCRFYYELARIGAGADTTSFGVGASSSAQRARDNSEYDLRKRLATEAELVPCPHCHWINDELVKGYRLGQYRGWGRWALAIAVAGSILTSIVSWIFHNGPAIDRWLFPYVLVGGLATFIGIAVVLFSLRRWLRSRIQPNRGFPREPQLPPGTPPALVLDKCTGVLRPAMPKSATVGDYLDFQFGRHVLPLLCCECLQPSDERHGYPLQATSVTNVKIPRCAICAGKSDRQRQRVYLIYLGVGSLVGAVVGVPMVLASVDPTIIILISVAILAATTWLMLAAANARTAPVTKAGGDPSRGVIRLRIRNPAYFAAVTQQLNVLDQSPGSQPLDR